MNRVGGRTQSV
jgi:monoamine oxidase